MDYVQIVSLAGAGLILLGYAGNHYDWFGPRDRSYNLMNLVGALLLLWVALIDMRWGFIVLEVVWAGISIPPLFRARSGGAVTPP